MEMDDDLESFLEEQRAKVAEDKASLEQDPPYMEIRTRPQSKHDSTGKENIPLAPAPHHSQSKEEGPGLSLPLGEEYERKKQRLQQELRLDYRRYMAQVKPTKMRGPSWGSRTAPENSEVPLNPNQEARQEYRPKRDAATSTEEVPWPSRGRGQGMEVETDRGSRFRDVVVDSGLDCSSEEMDLLDWDRDGRRRIRRHQDLRSSDRRRQEKYYGIDRLLRQKEVEPPAVLGDYRHRRQGTALPRQVQTMVPVRSRLGLDDDRLQYTSGLMIGHPEAVAEQRRRKEHYRQELEEQIAQQRKNRRREKDLELDVAATGATDPEKQPDRIPQLWAIGGGAVLQRPWAGAEGLRWGSGLRRSPCSPLLEKTPPERPRVAFPSPLLGVYESIGDNRLSPAKETFSRGVWSAMRDEALHSVPPPQPSTLTDVYRTFSEQACFCQGSRKAQRPSSAHWGEPDLPVFAPSQNCCPSPSRAQRASQLTPGMTATPTERPTPTYQEALKKQIQERQERRRKELQEKEQYEARLEAERKAYTPWGRGGGGAPLRDHLGNLITDLNQMHKSNQVAYLRPESLGRCGIGPLDRKSEGNSSDLRVPDGALADASSAPPGGTSVGFSTPSPAHQKDSYKDYLKQQIEEKRRRQAEERQRLKVEEEMEERRLEEQRAQIRREYEEEQEKRRRKEMEQRAKNEELFRQAEERRREEQRRKQERENRESESQRRQQEMERRARLEEVPREPSPPIPTLQKRPTSQYKPRPPSNSGHPAPLQPEHHLPGSQSPPVPARRNQLRAAEERRGILSELSALRRQLRSEQRRLEEQLLQVDMEELDTPLSVGSSERPLLDAFDMARLRLQAPVKRPATKTEESVNIQNGLGQSRNRGASQLSDPARQTHGSRTNRVERPERSSLLESESAFIGPGGQAISVPPDPNPNTQQLSARERRRMARKADFHNETRSRGNRQPTERTNSSCMRSEAGSMGMVGGETWLRPSTSDTLKSLLTDQDQGESPAGRALGSTWEGPSTYHG
ncbi:centrosome and spindle pole-associated protein 1-like [Brienomyrus brachyistius]|uniref:centrosome and spindle pole-associated protein 1-like n=1 Tax=Brienomyrus brachyistius TaxID=42636 RepID=UPI0020B2C2BC|nr:centrosome and spindle pole-associated protein 1-like [Brienomyrus brachyistius]XP_048867883.1 centrosome and spindle pole-associated protein 1-like [Brienomyrus brachyistius]XP_048867884.1 centrosome and spindle pole-associated protein 1-like [Brienomyrus brachyistius]